jgi:uncharacterized Zn finger protein
MNDYGWGWKPYVTVAERQRSAAKEMEKRKKQGHTISPVCIEGRTIARTFWGKSWCENLEGYSDYANRLPRGRSYVRNGSVVDLQIKPGEIRALVSGSELYEVELKIQPVAKTAWKAICQECSGAIDSLVELLQGRLSKGVMERICRQRQGLFPSPSEIRLSCSCPDWAGMCKHVAAVMYGIGARFDHQPELLFRLRQVDELELIANAGKATPLSKQGPGGGKVLEDDDLAAMFGLDMALEATPGAAGKKAKPAKAKAKTTVKSASKKKAAPKAKSSTKAAPTASRKLKPGKQTPAKNRRRDS